MGRKKKADETLLYRGTEHGFASLDFHNRCDNKGATLTVVHVASGGEGHLFGGYTSLTWTSQGGYKADNEAWLFSLRNKDNNAPHKLAIKPGGSKATYDYATCGFTAGGGHDIHIYDGCNGNTSSYANLGHSYKPPPGYTCGKENTKAFLAGSYKFRVAEIEVWQLGGSGGLFGGKGAH